MQEIRAGGDVIGMTARELHYHAPAGERGTPWQLPPRPEHFTGRETELDTLMEDLHPGRVLSVCGPGGMGKSALAAEALARLDEAGDLRRRFPGGVFFHSFYQQPETALVCEQIVRSVDPQARDTTPAVARRVLAGREALLVLDGTEEAEDLGAVLRLRGQCGALITSRNRGDAPDPAGRIDLTPLPQAKAVTLLNAWQEEAIDADPAGAICDQVDRLPLAVRLAGRYLDATGEPVAAYLAWLADSPIQALSHGEHREESVAVLLEKSLAQVSETARAALGVAGQLAFAPFAVAPVAAALAMDTRPVRRALGELVTYGLLQRAEGERYVSSHALVHTYARRRLGPGRGTVTRLAEYYTTLAETESEKGLDGYRRLDVERAHLVRALQGCADAGAWEAIRNLVWAINNYLDIQGYGAERVRVLHLGVEAAQQLDHRGNEGAFLDNLGLAYAALGQAERAIEHHQQALIIHREVGNRRNAGNALGNLGSAYASLGQAEKAINYHEQALAIHREVENRQGEGSGLNNLGLAYAALGQTESAVDCHKRALTLAREVGNQRSEGNCLNNLGNVHYRLGQTERAIDYYEQALDLARQIGNRRSEGGHLGNLGLAYISLGQAKRAIDYCEQGLAIARQIGDRHSEGSRLNNLGSAYTALGQAKRAVDYHEQALAIVQEIGDRRSVGYALGNLGNAYYSLGLFERSVDCYEQGLAIAQEIGDRPGEGSRLNNLGLVCADLGQTKRAIVYYEQALAIHKEVGDRHSEGNSLVNLGNAYANLWQMETAVVYYEQALVIFEEIRSPKVKKVLISLNILKLMRFMKKILGRF